MAATACAQDEHQRRLAAELLVMAGDAQRLAAGEPPPRSEGLRARLAGALSSLPLLLRQAGAGDAEAVPPLRAALERRDWIALGAGLVTLGRRHPLDLRRILQESGATTEQLRLAEAIHRQACAGCHDNPDPRLPLPALDLFIQAKSMPRGEFAARLLNGVRGVPATAYRNPFSDREIGALLAYYAAGRIQHTR